MRRAALGQPVDATNLSDINLLAFFMAKSKCCSRKMREYAMTIILTAANEISPEPIDWLWPQYLARGMLHLVAGDPGSGKTTVTLDFVARLTQGEAFPDGTLSKKGHVLIWSGEESIQHVIIPRLIAAGADLSQVRFIQGRVKDGEDQPFDPANDMEALRTEALKLDEISLVVFDPIVSIIRRDSHKNAETRRDLQPVVDLAKELNCAVIGITHFAKGTSGKNPLERIIGSVAFSAVTRLAFVVGKYALPDGSEVKRVFIRAKGVGQEGGGFLFKINEFEIRPDNKPIQTSVVSWGQRLTGSAQAILDEIESAAKDASSSVLNEAVGFLKAELKDGPMASSELIDRARLEGFSKSTLRRAKDTGVAYAYKHGDAWYWSLN